jgi:hypothetical protein
MPTVLRKEGFDSMIYPSDHAPSPTHVWKGGKGVVITLGDEFLAPYVGENHGMGVREKRKALQVAGENQNFLRSEWRRIHGDS